MKVYIGADHGGYEMKEKMRGLLAEKGYEVVDRGNFVLDTNDDYVDVASKVAEDVMADPQSRGVLLCRNGMGMSIVANRFKGIRCGLGFNGESVRKGRTDDDINVLSLPADYMAIEQAVQITMLFLKTEFEKQERYVRRINKINSI
jgi:ribose 5-phosphate isomerase B